MGYEIDVSAYEPDLSPTADAMPLVQPFDGSMPIDVYRMKAALINKIERARRNPMLNALDPWGERLYRLTSGGNLARVDGMSPRLKRSIRERDGNRCVRCGRTERLEVDHIVRYVDGGGNKPSNLRTLCHDCHAQRGAATWRETMHPSESTSGTMTTSVT